MSLGFSEGEVFFVGEGLFCESEVFEDCGLEIGGVGGDCGVGGTVGEGEGQLVPVGGGVVSGDLHVVDGVLTGAEVCNPDEGFQFEGFWLGADVSVVSFADHSHIFSIFGERRVEADVVLVDGEGMERVCESCDCFCSVCLVVGVGIVGEVVDVVGDLVDCVLDVGVDVVSAGHEVFPFVGAGVRVWW